MWSFGAQPARLPPFRTRITARASTAFRCVWSVCPGRVTCLSSSPPSTLLEGTDIAEGTPLRVTGQLRSFNNRSGHGSRLVISTFAQSIEPCDGGHFNRILLSGVLCKQPTLRRTPLGRSICDMILAVNRRYGRADYLPCIAWGKVAAKIAEMQVGDRLTLEGRVQSRTYIKQTDAGSEERTAYEVSVMQLLDDEETELI